MALADTAKLVVDLSLKGNFTSQIGKATKSLTGFDAQLDKTESRAYRAGQQIGTGIKNAGRIAAVGIGLLVTQIGAGLQSLIELESAQAQTNAVIKSTGGVAGVSAEMVRKLAEQYESLNATIGDETIQAGANVLLSFTNIREKAFEPALAAALDLSVAMKQDLQSSIVQVGKALNDPIRGITALRRVGVQLSTEQEKQIKALVEQNDLYGAQKIIIDELNKEFGGSFLAGGATTAGKVAKFTDSIEDLQRALAQALLPALGNVADSLSKTLADPKVIAGVSAFGRQLADLISPENLAGAGAILQEVFATAKAAAPSIAAAAQIMGQVVGTAVSMFRSLPKEIQQLAIGAFAINKLTGGLVTNIAGGLIGAVLKQLVSGVVNVAGGVVNVTGAPGLIGDVTKGTKGGGISGKVSTIASVILPIAAAEIIGSAIVEAMGGQVAGTKDEGSGRVVGEIAGVKVTLGQSYAAQVRAESQRQRDAAKTSRTLNQIDKDTRDVLSEARRQSAAAQAAAFAIRDTTAAVKGTTSAVKDLPGQIRNALGGILYGGGGRAAKDDAVIPRSPTPRPPGKGPTVNDATGFVIKVTSSIRDTNTAQDLRGRWGKTATQVGAA